MLITTSVRRILVRRPWIYWSLVGVLALAAGLAVRTRLATVDDAQRAWTETRTVWVAEHDHLPGEPLDLHEVELPLVAVPASAVDMVEPGAVARQRVASGETIVEADLTVGIGPAAAADDGNVVVPVSDPLLSSAPIGASVSVYAEGVVLAPHARIVGVEGDVLFVAVDARDGPIVAAAAQRRTASIAFTR